MPQITASASLRVISEQLSAREIGDHLKIEGARLVEQSDAIKLRPHKSIQRQDSRWILESELDGNARLQDHIAYLIAIVENNIAAFRDIAKNCNIDIWCTFSFSDGQGGFDLDNELLQRLAVLPVDLIFGLYSEQV